MGNSAVRPCAGRSAPGGGYSLGVNFMEGDRDALAPHRRVATDGAERDGVNGQSVSRQRTCSRFSAKKQSTPPSSSRAGTYCGGATTRCNAASTDGAVSRHNGSSRFSAKKQSGPSCWTSSAAAGRAVIAKASATPAIRKNLSRQHCILPVRDLWRSVGRSRGRYPSHQ